MKQTLLYVHGLHQPNDSICQALHSLSTKYDIVSPVLDPWKPGDTWRTLNAIQADIVVGFSLGGYYAATLQTEKLILINPALLFPTMLRERRSPRLNLIEEYLSLPLFTYQPSETLCILGKDDVKVGVRAMGIYKEHYPSGKLILMEGGHYPNINTLKTILYDNI